MQGLIKFHQRLLIILKKQNVTDKRTDNVKTVYPPTNTLCGGGGGGGGGGVKIMVGTPIFG